MNFIVDILFFFSNVAPIMMYDNTELKKKFSFTYLSKFHWDTGVLLGILTFISLGHMFPSRLL